MPATTARSREQQFRDTRVLHRQVRITTAGAAGSAVGSEFLSLPPGKVTHIKVDHHASGAATSDLTIAADPTDPSAGTGGVTIFSTTNSVTDIPWRALGHPGAVDEGRAATAATDATDGGAFVKSGIHFSIAQGDALTDAVVIDILYERLRMEVVELISQSGADGAGVVTRTLNLNGAGRLVGVEFDFQNMPATTDVVIKDSDSTGTTLFTSTDSATDLARTGVGIIGVDEGGAAIAATDSSTGGQPFRRGLFFDVAQADAFTTGNERILVTAWIAQ